jgi:heme/copper-type cytochrome/quinol oxidase subunit 2
VSIGADGWSSSAQEFHPDESPLGNMIFRSSVDPAKPEFEGSISEQDYVAVYTDTFTTGVSGLDADEVDNTPHRPLNIEVTQRSFAWSYDYAEDFILFDYSIRNIGRTRLSKVYMGIYVDADVGATASLQANELYADDICGFRQKAPATYLPAYCPPDSDIVYAAWIADNDGDLGGGTGTIPVPAVTATRIVRTPSESLQVSFNWWVGNGDTQRDFGPMSKAKQRNLTTGGTGTPEGDRNKYWFMSNREFDYDQVFCADSIGTDDSFWLPPNPIIADDLANGFDTRYLLSFGPFDIEPGQTLPLSFAYVAGDSLHKDPANANNLPPGNPNLFYENLHFADLDKNCTWADWIYDNPGVATDSDGYAGEFTLCPTGPETFDTVWRKGDGVPDFQGAAPPPSPATYTSCAGVAGLRAYPSVGSIRLRWNGVLSENARDIFSREYDFEGYRVYLARYERRSSYSVLTSFDIEDYNRYTWDTGINQYLLLESPFTLDQLLELYGEAIPGFHPDNYPRSRPLVDPSDPTKIYYFEAQDFNRSVLANDTMNATTDIRKVYPNAPKPLTLVPDSIPDTTWLTDPDTFYVRSDYLTDDCFFKYYEYEYTIENLLPTVPYWINVTAFDYGSPKSGLAALETNPTIQPAQVYPLPSATDVVSQDLKVYVYPNPYRLDANYQSRGYEGRGELQSASADWLRRIHFANLPGPCTIRIYSLDGDLVREIKHPVTGNPHRNHATWDLITRNTQQVVSGLYYWSVEDDKGNSQIGKLVIIL